MEVRSERVSPLLSFLLMGRPRFLAGGLVFHTLGVVAALYSGADVNLLVWIWGQLSITAIQLMTHYSNEYFDLEADRCNPHPTSWAGGSRVLPEGLLASSVALISSIIFGVVAIGSAFTLTFRYGTGPLTIPLIFLALILGWGYSSPPFKLQVRGLGEFTVAFVTPGLTPLLGFYLQTQYLSWLPVLMVLPLCLIQIAQSLSVNFPDADGDRMAGKQTLVVRLGGANASRLYSLLVLSSYALLPWLVFSGLPFFVAVAAGTSFPLGCWLIRRMRQGIWDESSKWDSLVFWSSGLLIGTACLEIGAFLIAWCIQ